MAWPALFHRAAIKEVKEEEEEEEDRRNHRTKIQWLALFFAAAIITVTMR